MKNNLYIRGKELLLYMNVSIVINYILFFKLLLILKLIESLVIF